MIADKPLGDSFGDVQPAQEQSDDFSAGLPANEDAPVLVRKQLVEIGVDHSGTRLFENNSGPDVGAFQQLAGLCIDDIQNIPYFGFPKRGVLSRLDLDPDATTGVLYNGILEPFRHQIPSRRDTRPLRDKDRCGHQMLVVEAAASPGASPRLVLDFRFGKPVIQR